MIAIALASLPLSLAVMGLAYPVIMRAVSFTVGKQVEHLFAIKIEQIRSKNLLDNTFISEAAKREADYVLETWGLLRIAYIETADVLVPEGYEDINDIPEDHLAMSLELHGLTKPQASAVISSSDRQQTFQRYYDAHRHAKAHDAAVTFNHYFAKHRIFMSDDIVKLFKEASKPMWNALMANDIKNYFASNWDRTEWERRMTFAKDYAKRLKPIEDKLKSKFVVMMEGYPALEQASK